MKTINKINQNIESILTFNNDYEIKKENLKLKPVKLHHVCLCGTLSGLMAICATSSCELSTTELCFFGGYFLGCSIPYLIKKIRVSELDFQINQNNKILDDLEKEKVKILKK